mmetsp:Transcript_44820/g.106288  ORF Transcript_44820/g.106288 Transcript_44820/m.106288 type:complete len:223 (-) Transcript_44820:255-923(-)
MCFPDRCQAVRGALLARASAHAGQGARAVSGPAVAQYVRLGPAPSLEISIFKPIILEERDRAASSDALESLERGFQRARGSAGPAPRQPAVPATFLLLSHGLQARGPPGLDLEHRAPSQALARRPQRQLHQRAGLAGSRRCRGAVAGAALPRARRLRARRLLCDLGDPRRVPRPLLPLPRPPRPLVRIAARRGGSAAGAHARTAAAALAEALGARRARAPRA